MSHEQNAGQNYNINLGNKYFKNVTQFKYFGKTATNQNCMNKRVNNGLNLRIACYHCLLSLPAVIACCHCLLSLPAIIRSTIFFLPDGYLLKKDVKIRITMSIISPVVLIWVWNLVLILKEKQGLKEIDNKMLK